MVTIRMLGATEHELLRNVAPDVFDERPMPALSREFASDPRHHLAVAIDDHGTVVGMASGVHYVHPDKPAQMFVNEVGVAAAYEGQGIGTRLLAVLLQRATELGCTEAWTATEPDNRRAQALYARAGGVADPIPVVMYTFPLRQA
jgi:ribosomal protein S18 acetylase RimI-like enzyme